LPEQCRKPATKSRRSNSGISRCSRPCKPNLSRILQYKRLTHRVSCFSCEFTSHAVLWSDNKVWWTSVQCPYFECRYGIGPECRIFGRAFLNICWLTSNSTRNPMIPVSLLHSRCVWPGVGKNFSALLSSIHPIHGNLLYRIHKYLPFFRIRNSSAYQPWPNRNCECIGNMNAYELRMHTNCERIWNVRARELWTHFNGKKEWWKPKGIFLEMGRKDLGGKTETEGMDEQRQSWGF
jgi:hypothetical protein